MAGTSRRHHVVTPQRRDVGSTNLKVNKWQRRDVSASFVFSSLKAKRGAELEASGSYELGHGNQSSSDIDLDEEPVICIFSRFLGQ